MRKQFALAMLATLAASAAALSSPARAGVVVEVGVPGVVVAAPAPLYPAVVAYPRPWAYAYYPYPWYPRVGVGYVGPWRGGWHPAWGYRYRGGWRR